MELRKLILVSFVFAFTTACQDAQNNQVLVVFSEFYNFNNDLYGWQGDFADYPIDDSVFYELQVSHAPLPESLGTGKSLMISGNNHSDDLFMFIKKKIQRLRPDTEYTIAFEIGFATDAEKGSVGAGGSPGESVFLKVGASPVEPMKVAKDDYYRMNISKGEQSSGGSDMFTIGNIAKSTGNDGYSLETRNSILSFRGKTNNLGELWLVIGTDSGYEGVTTLYYTQIGVVLSISE